MLSAELIDERKKRRLIKRYFWPTPPLKWSLFFLLLAALSYGGVGRELAGCLAGLIFWFVLGWIALLVLRTTRFGLLWKIRVPWLDPKVGLLLLGLTLGTSLALLTPDPSTTLLIVALILLVPRMIYEIVRPADAVVDQWLREDLEVFTTKAMDKLNLVEENLERPPLMVTGPIFDSTDTRTKSVRGRDGKYRFSVHRVVVLLLTRKYFGVFDCRYDSCADITYALSLKDISYEHVVEVEVMEELELHEDGEEKIYTVRGKQFHPGQVFRLGLASSKNIQVPTRALNKNKKRSSLDPPGTPLDEISRALRSMKGDQLF